MELTDPLSIVAGYVLTGVTTALGAWFGAWAAFRFESVREQRRTREREIELLRRVLFALLSQRNYLMRLDADLLAPYRDNPARAYLMGPAADYTPATPVSPSDLLFLMGTEAAGLITTVQLADARYHTAAGVLRERSTDHRALQLKLEQAELVPGIMVSIPQVQKVAGPALATRLEGSTDMLYAVQAGALELAEEAYEGVEKFWRRRYPDITLPALRFSPFEPLPIPAAPVAPPDPSTEAKIDASSEED